MTERPDPTLVRLCCDGEATPEQAAKLREYMAANPNCCADIQSQLDCEAKLRESVRKLMSDCPCAPVGLRDGVCKILSEGASQPAEVAGHIGQLAERRRQTALRTFFASTQRANWLAVAATLMLIAGAVAFGIFGRTIDDVRPVPSSDFVAEAAVYVDQEHRNLASGKPLAMDATHEKLSTAIAAESYLSDWLGTPVKAFDLTRAGYEFIGAERGRVSWGDRIGHLVYQKVAATGQRRPMLSVFMMKDQGQCQGKLCESQKSGTWCCITERSAKCKKRVLRGTDGNLVYFAVCCDDGAIDSLVQAMPLATAKQPAP